jgi:hypothetical protein
MNTLPVWRRRIFWAGVIGLLVDVGFYFIWRHEHNLGPCRGLVIGTEIGFLAGLIAITMVLFGNGWRRWAAALTAAGVTYIWFSWFTYIAFLEC